MRVLAATVGALLISVSHIALAQEHQGGMPQGEWQHGETARAERQREPLPASLPQTWTPQEESRTSEPGIQQAELRQDQPVQPGVRQEEPHQPAPMQDEMRHEKPTQPETFQAKAQPELDELLKSLPEARLAISAQAEATEAEKLLESLPDARPVMSAQARETEAQKLLKSLPEARRDQPMAAEMEEEPRQPEAMTAEVRLDQPTQTEMPGDPKWTALKEQSLGTTMDLPGAVFSMADGRAHKGVGRKYRTPDGRAKVAVWTQRNTRRDTPESYLRRTFNIPRTTQDYERFTPDFAAVSGAFGGKVYYIRCNLSPQGAFHCFDLAYPVPEKKAWDGIVTRMSRSLRPLYY